jgi:hypothetical protein
MEQTSKKPDNAIQRRYFFQQLGGISLTGIGLWSAQSAARNVDSPTVQRYKLLGNTGMEISDISFGGSRLYDDPAVVEHAIARGINYFDTAESYTGGASETAIGKAIKGKRHQLYLATKGWFGANERKESMMQTLEESLQRLRTDYVDVYFLHAVNDVDRLRNAEFYEFTDRAKQAGKIRFVGLSGHGGYLIPCLNYAMDTGKFAVMLVAYNFGQDPAFYQRLLSWSDMIAVNAELPRAIERAKARGLGVIAMKTLRGAKLHNMAPYKKPKGTFAQAAFRWVLSNTNVDALIISMTAQQQIDEYLVASGGTRVSQGDLSLLQQYVALNDADYCRPVCNACESSCPHNVPISDVLRYKMYFDSYGAERKALEGYARLSTNATACLTCTHQSCLAACPYSLRIPELTRDAHQKLVWDRG